MVPKIEEVEGAKMGQRKESAASTNSMLGEGLGLLASFLSAMLDANVGSNRSLGRDKDDREEEENELEKRVENVKEKGEIVLAISP
jgi:hypothetical protein